MSYIGHFLIATPSMGDPRFAETVVLITEHQDSGAWGFVINKQLDTTISQLVSVSDVSQKDVCQFIYWGGPVINLAVSYSMTARNNVTQQLRFLRKCL